MLHDLAEFGQVVVGAIAGIVVAWYWSWRTHVLKQYRYLDNIYWKLLDAYAQRPDFGDPNLTLTYEQSFHDDDALGYHYFAMRVHTVMETIYDIYHSEIPEEWIRIFDYHSRLHATWLQNNPDANEQGYVKRVLGETSATASYEQNISRAPEERLSIG